MVYTILKINLFLYTGQYINYNNKIIFITIKEILFILLSYPLL